MLDDAAGDDDLPRGLPPHPDDRLWRHPSEMVGALGSSLGSASPERSGRRGGQAPGAEGVAAASPAARGRRSLVAVGLVAAVAGAATAIGAVAVTGSLTPRVVAPPRAAVAIASSIPAPPPAPEVVAAGVARAVARVEAGSRLGAAVIVRPNGVLVTTAAVVGGADRAVVVLADGRRLAARVLGPDRTSGLAALRVERGGLPTVEPATSDPRPGEMALLVGGPDERRRPAVWLGAVTRLGRQAEAAGLPLHDLVETDRAPGADADGAALVTMDGRVAGVSVAATGADEGAGYAVPIGLALTVADDLVAYGRVRWAWLGVEAGDVPASVARSLGIDGGASVTATSPGSPAERAGLRKGDVVVALDDRRVPSMDALVSMLRRYRPGDVVAVEVRRGKGARSVSATLTAQPDTP
ncbi:MAG: trypsin-like peptidase domain-containing protein [Actinobacteria bacterium]|nr:trypsin-like peptidase domain-containing protein [Actinomycetota bacterium]